MTALGVVGRAGNRGRDGVHDGGGLVRVARRPNRDRDDDRPGDQLSAELTRLAFFSATSHVACPLSVVGVTLQ